MHPQLSMNLINVKDMYAQTQKAFANASFYSTVLTVYLKCTYLESTG